MMKTQLKKSCRALLGALMLVVLGLNLPARAQTVNIQTVDVGNTGSAGQYTSQAIVDGKPAISYYDSSDLKYAINSAADGSGAWSTVTVDSTGNVGLFTSLAVVDGKPAISYYDFTNLDLKYAYAGTVTGGAAGDWTKIAVDSTGDVGLFTSLAVVDGKPAISYYDSNNRDLKYAINSAADGSGAWSKVTVDGTGSVGTYSSLAVVNGKPSISYFNSTSGYVKYAYASTVNGAAVGRLDDHHRG